VIRRRVRFDSRAAEELDAAADWYDERRAGLGLELVEAVDDVLEKLKEMPNLGAPVPGVKTSLKVRSFPMKKFPFTVAYLLNDDEITVVAIAHESMRPGYWRERILE
jgi:toxin ParE1/3/4